MPGFVRRCSFRGWYQRELLSCRRPNCTEYSAVGLRFHKQYLQIWIIHNLLAVVCSWICVHFIFSFCGTASQRGPWPHFLGFCITHYTPKSVRLLWTNDQLVAKTSVWQHTNIHVSWGIRTYNLSRRAVADLRFRPRVLIYKCIVITWIFIQFVLGSNVSRYTQTLWHFCLDFHSAFQQTLGYYPVWAVTTYFLKTPSCWFVFLPSRLYSLICPQHSKLNRKFPRRRPARFFLGKVMVRMVKTISSFDETHYGTVLSQLYPVHTSISKLHAVHFSVSPTCVYTLIFRMGGSIEFCL